MKAYLNETARQVRDQFAEAVRQRDVNREELNRRFPGKIPLDGDGSTQTLQ